MQDANAADPALSKRTWRDAAEQLICGLLATPILNWSLLVPGRKGGQPRTLSLWNSKTLPADKAPPRRVRMLPWPMAAKVIRSELLEFPERLVHHCVLYFGVPSERRLPWSPG